MPLMVPLTPTLIRPCSPLKRSPPHRVLWSILRPRARSPLPMSHAHTASADMDMGMGGSSTSTSAMTMSMKNYFHGTLGDPLWFSSWAPTSGGSFFAGCLVLCFLGVFDRFLAGVRGMSETRWRATTQDILSSTPRPPFYVSASSTSLEKASGVPSAPSSSLGRAPALSTYTHDEIHLEPHQFSASKVSPLDMLPHRNSRWSPPFIWRVDVLRGLLRAIQSAVHYLLMLGVMSFNIYWFVSVVVGEGVGEILFGRFCFSGH